MSEDLDTRVMQASLEHKLFGAPRSSVKIDRFVVLERLGQGAMGLVYAVYDDKLDRRVALKLLKGDASSQLRLRLQREAQAMARLSHPNVVPVFEVGEHEGQLFIVLEYVHGQTLRQWVEAERPSVEAIVEKYVQAARGLAAAHAEGIVHRDFKPDNAIVGGGGRVRVLDFGLARKDAEVTVERSDDTTTSDHDNVLETPLTQTGSVVGTPAYMGPEQFDGTPADHRTDQFAFCVALWEAIGGARPFAGNNVRALVAAMASGALAPPKRPIPAWIRRVLERGLERVPKDRWPSMPALIAALERGAGRKRGWWIAGIAGVGVAGVAAFQLANADAPSDPCVDGPAKIAAAWDDARRGRVRAAIEAVHVPFASAAAAAVDENLALYASGWLDAYRDACEATHVQRTQSQAVLDLRVRCLDDRRRELEALADVLESADAKTVENAARSSAQLMPIDRCSDLDYVAAVEPLPEDPQLRERHVALLDLLAKTEALETAGRYDDALATANEMLAGARELEQPPLVLRALNELASVQTVRGDYDAALTAALQGLEQADVGSSESAAANSVALSQVLFRKGRAAEALAHARRALAIYEKTGAGGRTLGVLHMRIGEALQAQSKFDEAEAELQRALELQTQTFGEQHPLVATVHEHLGFLREAKGDYEGALAEAEKALAIKERAFGSRHPEIATGQVGLGVKLAWLGRDDEAEAIYRKALALQIELHGADKSEVGTTYNNLALTFEHRGRYPEALEHYGKALAIWEAALGSEHPNVALAHNNIGGVHQAMGDFAAALVEHEKALAIGLRVHGEGHANVGGTHASLGTTLSALGRYDEALDHLQKALAAEVAALGEAHPYIAADRNAIADVLSALGRHDDALAEQRRALAVWDVLGPERDNAAWAQLGMGFVLAAKGDCEGALPHLQQATKIFAKHLSEGHVDRARPAAAIVRCAMKVGRREEAEVAVTELRTLARADGQPPVVAALLAFAEGVLASDRAAIASARARLASLSQRPFVAMADAWLERGA